MLQIVVKGTLVDTPIRPLVLALAMLYVITKLTTEHAGMREVRPHALDVIRDERTYENFRKKS